MSEERITPAIAKARRDAAAVRARVEAGELSRTDAHWEMQVIKYEILCDTGGAAIDETTSAALDAYSAHAHAETGPGMASPTPSSRPTKPATLKRTRAIAKRARARDARTRHPRANCAPHA